MPPTLITRAHAAALAESLRLPDIVVSLASGKPLEDRLRDFFGTPDEFFLCTADQQLLLGGGEVVPLWDDGNFSEVSGFYPAGGCFVTFDVEDPVHPSRLRQMNWQQLLIAPFTRIWESESLDDRFEEIAAAFDFKYAARIVKAYAEKGFGSFGSQAAWYESLMNEAA